MDYRRILLAVFYVRLPVRVFRGPGAPGSQRGAQSDGRGCVAPVGAGPYPADAKVDRRARKGKAHNRGRVRRRGESVVRTSGIVIIFSRIRSDLVSIVY